MKFPTAVCAGAVAMTISGTALADLPKTLMMTSYSVGTAGYAQAVAFGAALEARHGITLRVLPSANDQTRLAPVRKGKAQFSFNGLGAFSSQEAVFGFSGRSWGPQQVRVLAFNFGDHCLNPYAAGDLNVMSVRDIKGLRVAVIKSAPALNYNVYPYLRFANLSWSDVERVEFANPATAQAAIAGGAADVAFGSTRSGYPARQEASARGLAWPAAPHDDAAGWRRFEEAAPYFVKRECAEGALLSDSRPLQGAVYPYPIFMTYADTDDDLVYAMTKALYRNYGAMKSAAPGMQGWNIANQELSWVVPIHDGAVRYYKEIGKWTADHQKNTDQTIRRQGVLQAAWAKAVAVDKGKDDATFRAGWKASRAAALAAAGFKPAWTDWEMPD